MSAHPGARDRHDQDREMPGAGRRNREGKRSHPAGQPGHALHPEQGAARCQSHAVLESGHEARQRVEQAKGKSGELARRRRDHVGKDPHHAELRREQREQWRAGDHRREGRAHRRCDEPNRSHRDPPSQAGEGRPEHQQTYGRSRGEQKRNVEHNQWICDNADEQADPQSPKRARPALDDSGDEDSAEHPGSAPCRAASPGEIRIDQSEPDADRRRQALHVPARRQHLDSPKDQRQRAHEGRDGQDQVRATHRQEVGEPTAFER